MFRKPRFRPLRRVPNQGIPQILRHANELISLGHFEEAAEIFEQLACGAQAHELPQDAKLFMAAGHCRIQSHQIDLAMRDLK
jgi:hypothetical protein